MRPTHGRPILSIPDPPDRIFVGRIFRQHIPSEPITFFMVLLRFLSSGALRAAAASRIAASNLKGDGRRAAGAVGATALAVGTGATAAALCQGDVTAQQDDGAKQFSMQLSAALATVSSGVSVMAAAAPTLCAVHCAAMPIAAVLMPSLQAVGGGKLFGGVCMHKVGRRLAYYFVIPLGLLSNAVGYPQHQNLAVTGSSLTGIAAVTAATSAAAAPYRLYLNLSGCALMLGSSYFGNRLAAEAGRGCNDCCADAPPSAPAAPASAEGGCKDGCCS